jgi:hypothetical protein
MVFQERHKGRRSVFFVSDLPPGYDSEAKRVEDPQVPRARFAVLKYAAVLSQRRHLACLRIA